MIWTSKEGEEVMDMLDTADSSRREVLRHPTASSALHPIYLAHVEPNI